jgi:hypothetical protein
VRCTGEATLALGVGSGGPESHTEVSLISPVSLRQLYYVDRFTTTNMFGSIGRR